MSVLCQLKLMILIRKIIHYLQMNGRLANQELAELVGLSTSQCSRRRIQLEQNKIITGYYANRIKPRSDTDHGDY